MTEAEWLAATDAMPMLQFLVGKASDRKLRLFICAWGYDAWSKMLDECSREAIVVAERFADGLADQSELTASFQDALCAWDAIKIVRGGRHGKPIRSGETYQAAKQAAEVARNASDPKLCDASVAHRLSWRLSGATRYTLACHLRDIFGNPCRPVPSDPSWLTSTVTDLARQMYESRDFSAMPILADALQDAGCDSDDILDHCRGPGPHVRGCWVVDLVLGKE
jgi:hypothetical protein